ncbi:hypothetical protein MBLNU457_g2670t2 [Dothideomycetes sp. NU457]
MDLRRSKRKLIPPRHENPEKENNADIKASWDDWVPQDRLRKFNEENKELASNLKKEMDAQRRAASKPSVVSNVSAKKRGLGSELASSARGSEERSSIAPTRGVKRARDGKELEGIEREEDFLRRPAIKLPMPDTLKSILVDDWEKVTKEQKLVPLPSQTPVSLFLDEYHDSEMTKRREGSADADILEEVIAGVREYFNKCLGRLLLYKFERPQWQDFHAQITSAGDKGLAGKQVVDVYGCEHLLRLFVSMPDLIAHTNMDSQAVTRLREELFKMTQYLNKHTNKYFTAEYEHAANDYLD